MFRCDTMRKSVGGSKMEKKQEGKNQKVIIVNNMFTGSYGLEKENLPHEMINFFKSDSKDEDHEGQYYIYITPYGTINANIKKADIEGILFIRSVGNGMVEVLAKAEVGENSEFYTEGISLDKNHNIASVNGKRSVSVKNEASEKAKKINETIFYGGKSLKEIHEKNKFDNEILVSMKVDKICLPKKTFYLTNKVANKDLLKDVYFLPSNEGGDGKKIANESMLAYYYKEDNLRAYEVLKNILRGDEAKTLWEDEKKTLQYNSNDVDAEIFEYNNFFKITRQQDNEVMFSNMLFYYFSNAPAFLKYFAEECLGIRLEDEYKVEREKDRMDIRIIDEKNYIIIENKIKSGINGLKKKSEKKEEGNKKAKYNYNEYGYAIDEQGKLLSQLSDYIGKATENKKDSQEIKAYIFEPDYSVLTEENLKEKYSVGEQYKVVRYSEIKKAFEKYTKHEELSYYKDFLYALNKHTKKIDDEHRLNLLYRLKCRIENK